MAVGYDTIKAEGKGHLFEKSRKSFNSNRKKLAFNVMTTPGRFVEEGTKYGSAAEFRNPNVALSLITDVIGFYKTGNCSFVGGWSKISLKGI